MARKETRLPSLKTLEDIKEALDVRLGRRGDRLDKAVTFRDLVESGQFVLSRRGNGGNGLVLTPPGGTVEEGVDLATWIPQAPENLSATGMFGGIGLTWSWPAHLTSIYAAEVYRSTSNDASTRQFITAEGGLTYFDRIDSADQTEYFYWVRFRSRGDKVGPFAGPVSATVLPLVRDIMERITGEIDSGVLAQSLREEIERIESLSGTLDDEIARLEGERDRVEGRVDTIRDNLIDAEAEFNNELDRVEGRIATIGTRVTDEVARLDGERDRVEGRIADEVVRLDGERDRVEGRVDTIRDNLIDAEGLLDSEISRVEGRIDTTRGELDVEKQRLTDEVARIEGDVDAVQGALDAEALRLDQRVDAISSSVQTTRSELESEDAALLARLIEAEQTIVDESEVRHTEDQFQAERVQGLVRVTDDHSAHIGTLQRLRDDADLLEAIQFEALTVETANRQATIRTHEQVRITEEYALAQRAETIEAALGDNAAAITQEQIARADAESAIASQIGELSAKLDAQPTFGSGFEPGTDFDQWAVASTDTLTVETSDVYLGTQTGLLTSTATNPNSSGTTGATYAAIPSGATEAFEGYEIVVRVAAKQPSTNASAEFAVAYSTASVGNSSWQRFVPGLTWEVFEFRYQVPEGSSGNTDYIGIWADTSGGGGGVLLDAIRVQRANAEITEITAAITTEQQARVDADNALASDISALQTSVGENEAAIIAEETARTNAVAAEALRINALNTRVGDAESSITSMETAYTNADAALASRASSLETRVDDNESAITQERSARTNADSALATDISALQATVGDSESGIVRELSVLSDADSAMASDISSLQASVGDAESGIIQELSVLSDADSAMASDISVLQTSVGDSESGIIRDISVLSDADTAMASDISALETSVGDNEAAIIAEREARSTAVSAEAARIDALETSVGENEADILQEQLVRSTEVGALAQDIGRLQARGDGSEADISSLQRTSVEAGLMEALQFEALGVESAGRTAAIRTQQQITDDGDTVSATRMSEIEGDVGTAQGSIEDIENLTLSPNSALVTRFSEVEARVGDTEGSITGIEDLTLSPNSALITRFSAVEGRVESTEGSITDIENLNLSSSSALITRFSEIEGSVDDAEGSIRDIENLTLSPNSALITRFSEIEGDVSDASGRIQSVEDMDLTADTAFVTSWNELYGKVGDSEASITAIENLTLDENSQLISRFEAAEGRIGNTEGSIQALETMDLTADTAFVTEWSSLKGRVGSAEADITQAEGAIEEIKNLDISADSALVERFTTIEGSVEDAEGRILEESSVRARENSVIVQELDSLQASQGSASSDISSLSRVTTETDLVQALQFEALGVESAGRSAAIRTQQQIVDDGESISATRMSEIEGSVDDAEGSITNIENLTLSPNSALITRFTEIEGSVEDVEGSIRNIEDLDLSEDSALITRFSAVEGRVESTEGSITDIENLNLAPDSAIISRFTEIEGSVEDAEGSISNIENLNLSAGSALITRFSEIEGSVDDAEGAIRGIENLTLSPNSALAKKISQIDASIGDYSALAQTSLVSEVSDLDDRIEAVSTAVTQVDAGTDEEFSAVRQEMTATSSGDLLVQNGSFDRGLDSEGNLFGWHQFSNITLRDKDPGGAPFMANAPSASFAEVAGDGASKNTVSRPMPVNGGEKYTFKISWGRRSTGAGGMRFWLQQYDANNNIHINGPTIYNVPDISSFPAGEWRSSKPEIITLDPDTVKARVVVTFSGTGGFGFTNVIAHRADVTLGALYTAKVQANGLIGGFGLYNDGETVEAGFDVDRFWVGRTNDDKIKPFIIDGGTVYMDEVMIRQGAIQEGQLGGGISFGKLLDDGTPFTEIFGKLQADDLDVDNIRVAEASTFTGRVQSTNYSPGSFGWMLDPITGAGQINFPIKFSNVTGAGALASRNNVTLAHVTDAGTLAGKDSLKITEILNAGALASKSTVDYDSDVTNKPTIDIRRLNANAYNGNQLPDAYSNDHKVGQLIFELSGASGWPEANGGVVTYWYANNRATQVCYGNDNDKEFVRYTRPNIYPQWTDWKQKEVFSSADVKILETSGAGALAAKDSVAINEVLNAGALASKNSVDYETEVTNKQIIKLGTNPYHNNDKADAYSAEHKNAAQLLFTCSPNSGWPTSGGCVTYWTHSNRASQVCYSTGDGMEWVRRTNPGIYPEWTDWVKKEVFSSSDVDALQTVNGPAQAGADKTGSNTAADTAKVAGTDAATVRDRANNGNNANNRVNSWTRPDSTLINGNKIYTGDAYVDTLQIKGQAVTIPVSTYLGGAEPLSTSWNTVLTFTLPSDSDIGNLIVTLGFVWRQEFSFSSVGIEEVTANVRVTLGGSEILASTQYDSGMSSSSGQQGSQRYASGSFSFSRTFGPAMRGGVLNIQVRGSGQLAGHSVRHRYVNVIGAKR